SVVCPHTHQHFRNFLSIGADILYRGSSNGSGNAAQALDAGRTTFHTQSDDPVPFFARAGAHNDFAVLGCPLDTADADLYYKTGKTNIGDQQVGTTAKDKQGQILFLCPMNGVTYSLFVRRINEVARRTANAEGRQGTECDVLLDECFHRC